MKVSNRCWITDSADTWPAKVSLSTIVLGVPVSDSRDEVVDALTGIGHSPFE